MTSTGVRRLAYRHFERVPGDRLGVACWAIEELLGHAHDYNEPTLIETAAWLANPSLCGDKLAAEVEHLLDLAEQVEKADNFVTKDDDWQPVRAVVVDEYLEQLERVAKAIGGAS